MKEALLVIDVQNDYFPGGTNELHNPYEAEARIIELITESRKCGRPIIYIQHINPPDDYFFLEGTHGVEISDRIKPCTGDKVIVKHFPNSFLETELNDYLKSLDVDIHNIVQFSYHILIRRT